MDRLETIIRLLQYTHLKIFTFQYGQIRNLLLRLLLVPLQEYLHSSMDRLETLLTISSCLHFNVFTFQYGQIRNVTLLFFIQIPAFIYIPVWIDQKLLLQAHVRPVALNLHSSMDRLETLNWGTAPSDETLFTFQYGQIRNLIDSQIRIYFKKIYIPVWIDQKLVSIAQMVSITQNLHSSMDRLETAVKLKNI